MTKAFRVTYKCGNCGKEWNDTIVKGWDVLNIPGGGVEKVLLEAAARNKEILQNYAAGTEQSFLCYFPWAEEPVRCGECDRAARDEMAKQVSVIAREPVEEWSDWVTGPRAREPIEEE
jgi:hypothetical protein